MYVCTNQQFRRTSRSRKLSLAVEGDANKRKAGCVSYIFGTWCVMQLKQDPRPSCCGQQVLVAVGRGGMRSSEADDPGFCGGRSRRRCRSAKKRKEPTSNRSLSVQLTGLYNY